MNSEKKNIKLTMRSTVPKVLAKMGCHIDLPIFQNFIPHKFCKVIDLTGDYFSCSNLKVADIGKSSHYWKCSVA